MGNYLNAVWGEPVLLEEPWRNTNRAWNDQYCNEILEEIKDFELYGDVTNAQCLLLGPLSSGKTSFINSVISVCNKRYSNVAPTAGDEWGAVTRKYCSFTCENELDKKFSLYDTSGLMESDTAGFNVGNINYLINGNVKSGYVFNPLSTIKENDTYYRQNPTMADKIHCVVFVMRVDQLDILLADFQKKLRLLLTHTIDKDVPRILLLTRCDILCEEVAKNVGNLYRSVKVKKKVEQARSLFCIPISNIHPIVNYGEGEVYLTAPKSIPILLALRQMVHFSKDFIRTLSRRERL